jgi:peptidoglycan/xylan/chitin deacetylase (PgdA/CDA1 family)
MKSGRMRQLLSLFRVVFIGFCVSCTNSHGLEHKGTAMNPQFTQIHDKFSRQPFLYDSTKKYIYLSFDDGPQKGTLDCYQLCKQEGIKASFFMVGMHTAKKSDGENIVNLIRESYPQLLLANHSYTHANSRYRFFYQHPGMAELDFERAQTYLRVPYKIARLPGNRAWLRENDIKASSLVLPLTHLLDSACFNLIGWDVEWNFKKKSARPVQNPQQLADQIDSAFAKNETHLQNHLVILTHDRMFQRPGDTDSLAKFIRILKSNPNYILETVDHYPGLKKLDKQ